ncbi:MOXD1 1 [Tetrabaena socialis]|uniref:MOXD1 1 n=1 Tax=Tetrabaena socialis TaxID=47790 RepID=A0A2J7ZVM5_9CHLO|nr:MOXD1 1 [Tetrabaena socialis]|eukprot:PNH04333.1 MOXD1 1 [Tetrabaena socialis]
MDDGEAAVGVPQTVSWAYGRGYPSKHIARGDSAVRFVPEAGGLLWGTNSNASTSKAPTPAPAKATAGGAAAGANATVPTVAARLFAAADGAQPAIAGGRKAGPAGGSAAVEPLVVRASRDADDGGGGGTGAEGSGSLGAVLTVDVVMPNITVPSNATTNYLCTHVTLPHDRKYHIVGMRSLVQSPLIHHMILFACEAKPPPGSRVFSCLGVGGGPSCSEFYLGWAPGQMEFLLPPNVHYNNPDGLEGVVDASGFQVLYTPRLRQYDAGMLTLGQRAIVIPPGQPIVTMPPSVCPSTCTSQLRAPLRLLASGLHMHMLGRAIATQHIRNGTELPPVGSRRFYDFNFQSADAVLLASSLLLPGDSLITTCSYDSTSRTNVTTYGESTRDEMCFNFVLYYPRAPNFTVCSSMDSVGDPGVALCGGPAQVDAVTSALQQIQRAAAAAKVAPPSGPVDLAAVPPLAPLFQSGALVHVPPNDTVYAKPYGRDCPDLSREPAAAACRGCALCFAAPAALALLLVLAAARGASAARCYASLSAADFPHCSLLSPSFALHWAVRGGNVTLGMDADTGGGPDAWLAVALSEGGGMIGADMMIVAGGGEDGGWRVIDAHSLEFAQPLRDTQQDVSLLGQPLSGPNNTVAVVTRRLRTCDPWDKEVLVDVPQTVSWAYGRGYPSKHTARGNSAVFFVPEADRLWGVNASAAAPAKAASGSAGARVTSPAAAAARLFAANDGAQPATPGGRRAGPAGGASSNAGASAAGEPSVAAASRDDDDSGGGGGGYNDAVSASLEPVLTIDVVMPNITVPSNATTNYLCTHVTLPHDRKYHIVGMRSLVQSPLIHHMILFACASKPTPGSGVYSCLGTGGGPGCNEFYLVWAPGQMQTLLPPTVHYNNPNGLEGVVDDSGFQVLYTPQLRQYDAGVLTLGQTAISIPPGQPIVTLQPNVCPSTCTSRLHAPVQLLSSALHMHTLGRAITSQHIRNGTELPPVGSRRFYDFNFQGLDAVPLASSLLTPGDSLITTCSYDSTSRTDVTKYGESTQDEMCFNFLYYYPRDRGFSMFYSMDSVGDPGVALCGGTAAAEAVGSALQQMQQAAAAPKAATLSGPTHLADFPALAPLFESGPLVRVPPNDSVIVKPYGRQCPDMSYVWVPGHMQSLLPPTIHYNNPSRLEGVVDDSGFQVLYTPQLRQYDAGLLSVGQVAISIPPGRPIFTLQPNVCPSTCTSRLRTPLRLLSSMLHMHTLGRAMTTQDTRDEMCFNTILYYPRDHNFGFCYGMDTAGDPGTAQCGGYGSTSQAADAATRALQKLQQQRPQGPVDLAALPPLAPLFRSGALAAPTPGWPWPLSMAVA